jgi:hypothetical protein
MGAMAHESIPRYIIWDPTSGPSDLPNVSRLHPGTYPQQLGGVPCLERRPPA